METYLYYMMEDPLARQELMACVSSITLEKCKEILLDHEQRRFEKKKQIMQSQKGIPTYEEKQIQENEMNVFEAILVDEMFEAHGLEEGDFHAAITRYNLMEDPEVEMTRNQIREYERENGGDYFRAANQEMM